MEKLKSIFKGLKIKFRAGNAGKRNGDVWFNLLPYFFIAKCDLCYKSGFIFQCGFLLWDAGFMIYKVTDYFSTSYYKNMSNEK